MRLTEITPIYVEQVPEELEEGVLYISDKYDVAVHLCACGCKVKTVTPLADVAGVPGWKLTGTSNVVTLRPSIGNFSGEKPTYHAHYFITNNKIQWC